ncbi:DNA glycosylase AlkZ-like family protein [Salinibacterium soli]|uniref:Crosslink repair DNA glycosylase YcaQ family protein n=1 Tax=Antiquaquibacter soli TaxID=3064523 RepID=A0ABT9BL93_9MICO|nr:crosslink repair DNA glycosylase YcaQ family protein [Protaetiibacter sp. WY-16]MDO7881795.1 crosslink repair DNA glycosylase YcaQ family protein [Protaetiibacter sp. WY-16]
MVIELSRQDARRIAVTAQLLDDHRPDDLVETVGRLGFVQVEPTAAVAPTADLVLWSRLGSGFEPSQVTEGLERDGTLFELDLLVRPMADLPLFLAEMAAWPERESTRRWLDDNEEFIDDVLDRLELEGPLTARDIPDTSLVSWPSSGWNNNRNVMMVLECLMRQGRIAVCGRRGRDRLWDLAERVYHADTPTVPMDQALRIRAERRLAAQGLVPDRTPDLPVETTRVGDAGIPAAVEGVRGSWRLDPAALDRDFAPRTALLSPFDGLIRDRKRMALLFEFDYALEMYKPAAKRRWGYYALPVLHGDRLIGKLDATADRDRGILVVHALHEDEPFAPAVRRAVINEIESLADWLGLRVG